MREVRGRDIGMVFQEPMTSLNPVLTIGRQITRPWSSTRAPTAPQLIGGRLSSWRWSASPIPPAA